MVDIVFTVSSVGPVSHNTTAVVGGQQVPATVQALQVEFTSDHFGSLTLQFIGLEATAAKEIFTIDSKHTWAVV